MRYIRQEILPEIGKEGQKKILDSKIAIIGAGALGTMSAELLVRSGVLNILLVDKDEVHEVNLQRQLYFEEEVGHSKALTLKKRLLNINKNAQIKTEIVYLNADNTGILDDYSLILDCTDNMKARHAINNYCMKNKKIWVYAAASTTKGNVLVVDDPKKFESIFKSAETFDACSEVGVINTITTMISSLQVTQALKIVTGNNYSKKMIRINIWDDEYKLLSIK